MNTRRQFLLRAPLGVLVVAAACRKQAPPSNSQSTPVTPGAPPTFGTGVGSGPAVTPATFAEAEKLMQVTMTPAERQQAADSWRQSLAPYLERRTGPRKVAIAATDSPATLWNPMLPGIAVSPSRDQFVRSKADGAPLPSSDDAIAFAPVTQLSRWIESRQLTSERLTNIYLSRIERLDGKIRAIITLTKDHALARAKTADAEIAAGKYRGPLHGIPYGVKDLLDTKDIPTTYGAEPFRNRVPSADSAVVRRLDDAGAVLLAKLSLGALALNDIWFGGQTMNPWLLEEGASGSSAGPGAATAAALVAFSVGSETGGSIVSPAMRCGVTGLRPTFGRVPRTGAMTLCWSLDKLGPMTRTVEDAMLVLHAITGPDAGDASSVPSRLDFDATAPVAGLKVGYIAQWMKESPATDVDRAAMETMKKLKMELKEVTLPDWPYSSLMPILFAEGAASFEELALNNQLGSLKVQVKDAWPNLFPSGAIPFGGGLCAGRSVAAQGGAGNGAHLQGSRRVDRAVAARRAAHHHELHRSSIAHATRRVRRGLGSAQRLGPGPGESAAEVHSAASRAARHHDPRPAVRRRFDRASWAGARASIWRGRERPAGFCTRQQ